jgi:hypothetical protein
MQESSASICTVSLRKQLRRGPTEAEAELSEVEHQVEPDKCVQTCDEVGDSAHEAADNAANETSWAQQSPEEASPRRRSILDLGLEALEDVVQVDPYCDIDL